MSDNKKRIRQQFRDSCFKRDKYSCVTCPFKSNPANAERDLDAHHITNRREMPNGGYVKENGVSLCTSCHIKAETFHSTGVALEGFAPEDLYRKVGSTHASAIAASKKLS